MNRLAATSWLLFIGLQVPKRADFDAQSPGCEAWRLAEIAELQALLQVMEVHAHSGWARWQDNQGMHELRPCVSAP